MTQFATASGGVIDTVYGYDPRPDVDAFAVGDDVYPGMVQDGGAWVVPPTPLADLKATKVVALTAACAAAIVGGFASDALGAPHTYPSKPTDQTNLMGSVVDSMLLSSGPGWTTPFWCAAADGVWACRPHGIAEIQAAGAAGKAHVVACQSRLAELVALVDLAETAADLATIEWA